MNRSGIKRGLAATAISALALTGAPFFADSAMAAPLSDPSLLGVGATANTVTLFSQYSGQASTQNDGVNNTIHLLAGGGANVVQVRFEFSSANVQGGAFQPIATVSRTNDAFSTEFAPPVATFGQPVTIRATGIANGGADIAGAATRTATVSAATQAVDIANPAGFTLPLFQQPYATENQSNKLGRITGTTSGTGQVALSDRVTGSPAAPTYAASTSSATADANGVRTFTGGVNFSSYTLATGAGAVNEAVVGAQAGAGGSDDTEVVNLVNQTIGNVTATGSTVPTANPNTNGTGAVTVVDANQRPVVGAQVVLDANNDGDSTGDTIVYTDANGVANFSGLTGSAAGTTFNVYVNTTDTNAFEPNVDFRRTFTVTTFTQTATTVTSTSADGAAFDVDEFATGDLRVRVNDQNGTGFNNQTVSYSISFVPFTQTTPATVFTPQTGTVMTGADGTANIPFVPQNANGTYTLNAFIDRDGTPGQGAGDLAAAALVFKAGDSNLVFSDTNGANPAVAGDSTSAAGGSSTLSAALTLTDGTPLPGRLVQFTLTRGGAAGDATVAQQAGQPTGTTRTGDFTATDVTDANGVVSVAITDPAATPQTIETGDTVTATTISNTIGNANESDTTNLVFSSTTAPTGSTVRIDSSTGDEVSPVGTSVKPGQAVSHTVTVLSSAAGNPPLAGQTVTLTVDKGFFTNGTNSPAPVVGADAGNLNSLGQTVTLVTGVNGTVAFQTAIGRDTGFDDDGLVNQVITATITVAPAAGSTANTTATDTETDQKNSANPLNYGAIDIVQSPAATQTSTNLPRARTNERVFFDIFATDQFGNRVNTAVVNLTDNNADATINTTAVGNATVTQVTSDFDTTGDFFVTSPVAGDDTITGTFTPNTTVFNTTAGGTSSTGTETLTDSVTVNFYAVDFAAAKIALTSSPEGAVTPGRAVTETVTVLDQFDRPLVGFNVQFIRSGPSDQTGDPNVQRMTNANGQAFYSFTGTKAGTAQISAVITDGLTNRTVTDTVVFKAAGPKPPFVATVNLIGAQVNGGRVDNIRVRIVTQGKTPGSKVTLFRQSGGTLVPISTRTVGTDKYVGFKTADKNGNKPTIYVVKLAADAQVKAAQKSITLP